MFDLNPLSLDRFEQAQNIVYSDVLRELEAGNKTPVGIWFFFPQHVELWGDSTVKLYGIHGIAEAREYLADPVLSVRLRECCELLLRHQGRPIREVFPGSLDTMLAASMTLFSRAGGPDEKIFREVLRCFFQSREDKRTLRLLGMKTEPIVPGAGPLVLADSGQIQHLLMNLVANAVQAIGEPTAAAAAPLGS